MHRRAIAVVLLGLVPLVACSDDGDGGDDGAQTTTSTSTAATSSATSTTAADGTTTTTDDAAPAGAVVPGTHGIDVSGEGGSSFAFGSTDEVVDAISAVLGEPTDESDVPECPAGPAHDVRWGDQLQLVQQEGAFVGWSLGEGSTLRLTDGLAIGSTLQEVRDRYPDTIVIADSTIGIEIYAESVGLSGLITEDAPTGTVASLWAGTVCIFR